MKRLFKIILMLGLISSCAKDYDISNDNLNNTITVGGDNLTIPIGETDSIFLKDYINPDIVDMFKVDDDGNYYLEFSQEVNNAVSMSDIIDNLSMHGLESHFIKSFPLPDYIWSSIDENISAAFPFDTELQLDYSFEGARKYGLVDLDSLIIKSGNIKFNISMNIGGIENFKHQIPVDLKFSYPKRYLMYLDGKPAEVAEEGDKNNIVLHGIADSHGIMDLPLLEIRRIEFDIPEGEPFDFTDMFYIEELTVHFQSSDLSYITGTAVDFDVRTIIGSGDGNLIHFQSFYGLVDQKEEPVSESISFDKIPDFMKNESAVLDFYDPYLKLEVNTNLGVPMKADIVLSPKFKNSDNNGNAIGFTLDAPVSNDPDRIANKNYWLSSKKPSDSGQEYEWKNVDIVSLVKRFPDFLDITVAPYTDLSRGNHYEDFDAVYSISGFYSFIMPFSFGDELHLPMSMTIHDIPSIFTDIFSSENVTLGGELVSMFPVDVKVDFIFLDETGEKLDLSITPQVIKSVEQEGVPVRMPLNIAVTSSKLHSDISSIVLEITLLPGTKQGVPISENAFIWAKLNVSVPGGVTIDMDDLPDNNNDNNEMK